MNDRQGGVETDEVRALGKRVDTIGPRHPEGLELDEHGTVGAKASQPKKAEAIKGALMRSASTLPTEDFVTP